MTVTATIIYIFRSKKKRILSWALVNIISFDAR